MLKTKRLYLRNLCVADVDFMFAYRNDSSCAQYQRYEDTSREYLQEFVERFLHCAFLTKQQEQHYAIACVESKEMIGDLSIFFSEEDDCFTLGITIAPRFQRRGYAYELLGEVIAELKSYYPSVDIVALIERENAKSLGLFKKLGFSEESYAESLESYVFTIYGDADS